MCSGELYSGFFCQGFLRRGACTRLSIVCLKQKRKVHLGASMDSHFTLSKYSWGFFKVTSLYNAGAITCGQLLVELVQTWLGLALVVLEDRKMSFVCWHMFVQTLKNGCSVSFAKWYFHHQRVLFSKLLQRLELLCDDNYVLISITSLLWFALCLELVIAFRVYMFHANIESTCNANVMHDYCTMYALRVQSKHCLQ